jgi:hypothetical protein
VPLPPFNRRTNHPGPIEWRGRSGCNGWSIGIEIVNPGQLYGEPGKATSTFGRTCFADAHTHGRARAGRRGRAGAALAAVVMLGGCTIAPDTPCQHPRPRTAQ